MTNESIPHNPETPRPPALKQLAFSFPFQRKTQGSGGAPAQFTDEHDIYRILAASEPSGSYLVSRKGTWHGGIHITEAGAGQALDLDAGLRCIADGVLIAWRANKDYPVSEVVPGDSRAPFRAPYSTGFALVRHEMEFPRGTKLTFYSLYMHLMSCVDYGNFPKRQKPSYWSRHWQITQYAQDRPLPGRSGQAADPTQVGLRVRRTPGGPIVGILPQGESVSIGKTQVWHGATWGRLSDQGGATLYAPEAGGYVEPLAAVGGWIYLGEENGGPVAKERIPDSMFDRVIVATNHACTAGNPQGTGGGIPVKAGDLIGHLGRYDSLNECSSGTRMAHVEVFCDDGIEQFIKAGRAWVDANCATGSKWRELGLSSEPTILRVDRGTTLYQTPPTGNPAGTRDRPMSFRSIGSPRCRRMMRTCSSKRTPVTTGTGGAGGRSTARMRYASQLADGCVSRASRAAWLPAWMRKAGSTSSVTTRITTRRTPFFPPPPTTWTTHSVAIRPARVPLAG
jgi:hypothetical protein